MRGAVLPLSSCFVNSPGNAVTRLNRRNFQALSSSSLVSLATIKSLRSATDYIGSGARLESRDRKIVRDEIIAVINIDEKNLTGKPLLEIFSSGGLFAKVPLGEVPGFSCRHYLLSDLLSGKLPPNDLSLRLVDETATLLMSVIHLDYDRRHIAADHGSDRFSTFGEFTCNSSA